jgi:hypothetical protein
MQVTQEHLTLTALEGPGEGATAARGRATAADPLLVLVIPLAPVLVIYWRDFFVDPRRSADCPVFISWRRASRSAPEPGGAYLLPITVAALWPVSDEGLALLVTVSPRPSASRAHRPPAASCVFPGAAPPAIRHSSRLQPYRASSSSRYLPGGIAAVNLAAGARGILPDSLRGMANGLVRPPGDAHPLLLEPLRSHHRLTPARAGPIQPSILKEQWRWVLSSTAWP